MEHISRMESIYAMILNHGKISVEELSSFFGVTPTTIRRDLIKLEEVGLTRRTRGYAHAVADTERRISQDLFVEEKKRIALKAQTLVKDHMTLVLDSGSTVHAICNELIENPRIHALDMVTNSLTTALLVGDHFGITMPGGHLLKNSQHALVGVSVEDFFSDVHVDLAFMGTTGVKDCDGLTVSYPLHMSVKRCMVACANQRVAVLDSSKFIGRGVYTFCKFKDIDILITVEKEQNKRDLDRISKYGCKILLA